MNTFAINEKVGRDYLNLTYRALAPFVVVGAIGVGCVGIAIYYFFEIVNLAVVLSALAGIGVAFITAREIQSGMAHAQWLVSEQIAVLLDRVDAESNKLNAEADTIRSNGITQNFTTQGTHAKVTVNNAPSINQDIRLIPVKGNGVFIDGVEETDLADFVERIFVVGYATRNLMGYTLPSGATIDSFAEYDKHITPLVKAGVIVGRSERRKGQLTAQSAQEVKQILGISTV